MSKILTVYDDKEPLNNVVSALTYQADEVFFVYHHDVSSSCFSNIEKVITRYFDCVLHFLKLSDDEKQIREILDNNSDIIVDVGGAKYLSLLLFDLCNERGNRIIYYDDEENVIKDYRTHTVVTENVFALKIEDVLNLRGGEIRNQMHSNLTDASSRSTLLKIVENNRDNYSTFTRFIARLNSLLKEREYLGRNEYRLKEEDVLSLENDPVYEKREDLFSIKDDILTFKNTRMREMISVTGVFLENYIYIRLKESGLFDDIMMSVVIDFSDDKYRHPVECELDCLVIKNNHLLFVSCKSTKAETETLNEIYVHNKRFGNALSVPVLCVLEELDRKYPSVYAKGEELGIYLIDRSTFVDEDIVEAFLSIVDGTYVYDELL